jgi:hypothetical protein
MQRFSGQAVLGHGGLGPLNLMPSDRAAAARSVPRRSPLPVSTETSSWPPIKARATRCKVSG